MGIRQKVAFSLRRLRLALFDREHEGSENHCPQNPGCKPRCVTIVTFDYVACHWNTSLCGDLLAFWTWFPHSGYTLNKWVGAWWVPGFDNCEQVLRAAWFVWIDCKRAM